MPAILRLSIALFAVMAGFHGFVAAMPLALARSGVADPEIGLVMGMAGVVQLAAAFVVAHLIDRFGGPRVFLAGGAAHLISVAILLLPGVEPSGDLLPYFTARTLQGVGLATALPAALAQVPVLVPPRRVAISLSVVGSAHNLTLVVLPPLSIVALGSATSLDGVALMVAAFVSCGMALSLTLGHGRFARRPGTVEPAATEPEPEATEPDLDRRRRFGVAYRNSWGLPLLVILTYVAHWGSVTAYLPTRAEAAGADIGLFFAADGLAILMIRIPTGWLADRVRGRWLVLAGLAIAMVSIALLIPSPTTPILVISGLLGGAGGGLVLTPILVELSRRSDDRDRGSAFSLFSGALAGAISIGSIGMAPLIAATNFETTILVGLGLIVVAAGVSLADPGLATDPRRPR